MADSGWTHERVHAAWERTTGTTVSCATVHVGLLRSRWDPAHPIGYYAFAPWRIQRSHQGEHALRMLRTWCHREMGVPLDPRAAHRVAEFVAMLAREHAVVGYDPLAPPGQGFQLLPESWRAGTAGLPIRTGPMDGWASLDARPVPPPDESLTPPACRFDVLERINRRAGAR